MFDWLHRDLFSVTLADLLLRGFLLVLFVALVVRMVVKRLRHTSQQHAGMADQLKREQAFSNLGYQLSAATTPKDAAKIICDTAQELLGWHASVLKLYDPLANRAEVIIINDTINGEVCEVPPPDELISPITRQVFSEGAKLILRNDESEKTSGMVAFGNTGRRSASLMFVPIRDGTKPIGLLSIQSYDRNAYEDADLQVLQKLADHCGGALERIRAQHSARAAYEEMEERVKERTRELLQTNTRLHEEIKQHEQTEAALEQEQHVLKSLMDSIPDYIYFKDTQGRFTRVNTAFANQFGNCEPGDMIGKTDFHYLTRAAAEESLQDEEEIIRTGKPIVGKEEHEFWLNGHEWWVLTSKMPFRDPAGQIIGTFGITRDITQRKKAEEALQQAQQELEMRVRERTAELSRTNEHLLSEIAERKDAEFRSAAFSNLGFRLSQARTREEAAEVILESADQMLGWNAAYLHLYSSDYSRVIPILCGDMVQGKRVMMRDYLKDGSLTTRDRKIIEQGAELILRDTPTSSPDFSNFGDRQRPSLSLMFVPVRNGDRIIGGMSIQSYQSQAYTRDDLDVLQSLADFCAGTLERIEAERALRDSEERFSKAFLSSPVPMTLSTLRDGRYLNVNDSMLRLMGFTREEMIGRTSLELGVWQSVEDRARMVDAISKSSVRDMEFDLRTKGGQLRKMLMSIELMDFKSEPTILVTLNDITDRLHLEEQLRQSQKMDAIGQLAAGVAHDFNNILTIIQGHTSLLVSTTDKDGEAMESLLQVATAADRAANLTRQLLAFSRKQIMQARSLDMNDVVGTTGKMLQRLLGENISLHFNYSPQLPPVYGDSGMIEQVLINLAVNARDAMPRGGKLVISTANVRVDEDFLEQCPEARIGQFVCLSVSDTGNGIDPSIINRIFEPFFTTKEVGKGTGLGLATVYGIVKQHQGWIRVNSQPGNGATFMIYLPTSSKGLAPKEKSLGNPAVGGGKETILVVEDEPALRDLVRSILQIYGYTVIEAAHGREALSIWARRKAEIDLVLTDIVMPEGISGLDLADQLHKEDPALPVIYTSGYSVDVFTQQHKLREGVNFLAKPYQPKALVKAVRDYLDTAAA